MSYTSNLLVVAAVCGNFWQESTVNPGIWENLTVGAPGYGLGQWTDNAQVTRRSQLFNYLALHGYQQDSGPGQLEFMIYENIWLRTGAGGYQSQYTDLQDFLASSSNSLRDLTLEFCYCWEGIADGTETLRIQYAITIYDALFADDGTRGPWISGNRYLSQTEIINNAKLIMDWLYSAPPPAPGPTDEELAAILAKARKRGMKGGIILWN